MKSVLSVVLIFVILFSDSLADKPFLGFFKIKEKSECKPVTVQTFFKR